MKKIYHIPIEDNFIKTFVQQFLTPAKKDYSDISIVFPNKRPFLFLNRELANAIGSSFIPSKNFTIDEFVHYIVEKKYPDLKKIESIDAIWVIYNIIKSNNIKINNFEFQFEEFLPWGERIFKFINQLDTENIDNKKLTSIEENAEIGYDIPEPINLILKNIIIIRDGLHNYLEENQLFTRGFAYLKAAEIIDNIEINEFKKIYFAGLFALTRVEQQLIKKLWENDKAEIIWNGDFNDWPEILGQLKNFFNPAKIETITFNKINTQPEINLYSAFDTHSEVVQTFEILSNMDIKNTAIIVPVADTLFPLLSLAVDRLKQMNKIDTFNISLQYPLIRTSLFSLIKKILNIQKFIRIRNDGIYYSSKLYVDILSHPFIKNLTKDNFIIIRDFINFVIKSLKGDHTDDYYNMFAGNIYIRLKDIENFPGFLEYLRLQFNELDLTDMKDTIKKLHTVIFKNFETIHTISEIADKIKIFLDLIIENSQVKSYILSGEIFNLLFEQLNSLKNLLFATESFDKGKEFIINFVLSQLETQSISFSTTPLQELEIIGMLETRNLNFKNVILLDLQDSVLPGEKKIDPLIPIDLYKQLNLPDYEKQEEMNRFYFERIIKSAKNVHILYIEDENKIKSRYVEKIIWDKEKQEKKIDVYDIKKINFPINTNTETIQEQSPEVKKTPEILKSIENLNFSASAIDTYISCGLKFYFKNILKLEELGKISEEIEGGDRGTIVHKILSETYKKAKDISNYFSKNRYDEIKNILHDEIRKTFQEKPNTGEFYILKKIVEVKLEKFLSYDLDYEGFSIYGVEEKISTEIVINNKKIQIKGFIDRIDKTKDGYVIIDYKTGSSSYYSKVDEILEFNLNDMNEINKNIKTVQLPFYILLFTTAKNITLDDIVEAKYKFFTKKNKDKEKKLFGKENKKDIYEYYLKIINTVIEDIYNEKKVFKKWDNSDCANCIFNSMCNSLFNEEKII